MNDQTRTSLLVVGIIAGALSIPMTWFTIHNAQMNGPFPGMSFPGGMSFDVTGLNGSITFLFKIPIWFLSLAAVGANVLQLLRNNAAFPVSKVVDGILAGVACVWIAIGVLTSLSGASLGIGAILGLAAAVIPLVTLFIGNSEKKFRDEEMTEFPNE